MQVKSKLCLLLGGLFSMVLAGPVDAMLLIKPDTDHSKPLMISDTAIQSQLAEYQDIKFLTQVRIQLRASAHEGNDKYFQVKQTLMSDCPGALSKLGADIRASEYLLEHGGPKAISNASPEVRQHYRTLLLQMQADYPIKEKAQKIIQFMELLGVVKSQSPEKFKAIADKMDKKPMYCQQVALQSAP